MSQHAAKHVQPSGTIGRSQSAAAQPLTRRRMAALLALALPETKGRSLD